MKPIIILLLFLIPSTIIAQPFKYEIKGSVKTFKPGQILYFMHFDTQRHIDSVILNDGTFSFTGEAMISNEPEENYAQSAARLFLDHTGEAINFNVIYIHKMVFRDDITVYLEPGITQVNITDSVRKAIIIPPKITQGHYTLDSIYFAYYKKLNKAYLDYKKLYGNLDGYLQQSNQWVEIFKREQKRDLWQFVKTHRASPVSLYLLKHNEEYYTDYNKLAPYFMPLAPVLKNTVFGKTYAEKLNRLKSVRIGSAAPEFIMNDVSDKPVSLSAFKGQYVLIDFWASWCGPCREENPAVVKAYQQFKDQNFTILGVSLDEKKDNWVKAIAKDHLDWTQVSDLKSWDNAAAKLYAVGAIPQNFLIDPLGHIIATNLFGDELVAKLKQVLQPGIK